MKIVCVFKINEGISEKGDRDGGEARKTLKGEETRVCLQENEKQR